jgi:hypothetical protein
LRQNRKKKRPLPKERPSSGRKRPGRAAASQSEARNAALQQYALHAAVPQAFLTNFQIEIPAEKLLFSAK